MAAVKNTRHYGMDWLRIAAFAILIMYHSALFFSPGKWVIHAHDTVNWLKYPLQAITPWRLMVLFTVSGFATAALLSRAQSPIELLYERSKRILIPLGFGMLALVPVQSWIRLKTQSGYSDNFGTFMVDHVFGLTDYKGYTVPHWEHLWFLGYLWMFTAVLLLAFQVLPVLNTIMMRVSSWMLKGPVLVVVPAIGIAIGHDMIMGLHLTGSGMLDDWAGDVHYIPAFLFGFMVFNQPKLWETIRANARMSLFLSIAAYTILALTLFKNGEIKNMGKVDYLLYLSSYSIIAWCMLPPILAIADRAFNRDHKWRETLSRAIFPAYLVHQTIIVLIGWSMLDSGYANILIYTLMITGVALGSTLAYWLAQKYRLFGLFLGVAHKEKAVQPVVAPVPSNA
jgi:glucans biosynthesis protein C